MSLQSLYETLTPVGFFFVFAFMAFLLGLFLGWILWWSKSRWLEKSQAEANVAKDEAEQIRLANAELEAELKRREESGTTNTAEKDGKWVSVSSDPSLAKRSLNLAATTGHELNWRDVEGVDNDLADELSSLGIKNVDQLQSLSSEDRKTLEAKLGSKGIQWNWDWLSSWKTAGGVAAAGAAVVGGLASSGNSSKLGFSLPSVSGPSVDWGKVDGIDPAVAAELNGFGIESVEQLEALDGEQRAALEGKMRAKGLSWDWGKLSGWKTGIAAGGASLAAAAGGVASSASSKLGFSLPSVSAPSVDWGKVDGIDPAVAGELKGFGIESVEQLESLDGEQRAALEGKMRAKGLSWDWGKLSGWKTGIAAGGASLAAAAGGVASSASSKLGFSLPSVSGPSVDWGKVDGIDPAVAGELKGFGIESVEQLEALDGEQRAALEGKLRAKGLSWDWGKLSGWKASIPAVGASLAAATGGRDIQSHWYQKSPLANRGVLQEAPGVDLSNAPRGPLNLSLDGVTGPNMDWKNTAEVDAALADELTELGIQNIQQLENLSATDRQKLDAHLASKGHKWDWGWLTSWKKSANASIDNASSADTTAVGIAQVDGVSPEIASELKELGITSVDQLDQLSDEERKRLDSQLSSKGKGGWLSRWKTALGAGATAAGIAGAMRRKDQDAGSGNELGTESGSVQLSLPRRSGPKVDWANTDGIEPALAAEFQSFGIESVDQLENLSDKDRRALESRLSAEGLSWDWGWLDKWKLGDWSASTPSTTGFGEAKITGFAGGATVGAGTGSGTDGRSGTDGGAKGDASTGGRVATSGVSDSRGNADGSVSGGTTRPLSQVVGSDKSDSPNQIPIFADGIPKIKDDLTLLDGIDGPQAIELHKMGIHNFDQLHDLSAENRMRLQNWFRQRGWFLDMDQWRIASEGNTLNPTIEDIQQKAYEIYLHREEHNNTGGERTDWEQSEWELRGNPIFGYGVPHDVEDFAVSVTGITPEARDELYRMGLYNSWQVQGLDHDSRRLLTRWFAGPRFGVDLTMAFGWLSSLQSVPQDKNYGHIFANRPSDIDDLSDINGVGHATERDLNRIGIYQFGQIASWTDENIDAISETLELGNRVREDMWVVQAQQMAGQS